MDTYPRLAEGLDLAWTPDRSRIVAYNTSSGNVVATLTVKGHECVNGGQYGNII